ncbi:MAG: putative membrane protein insertion efficiency factor [Bacteroidia bacterium]|jgi:putative membrane protein insertion efficiency factor
MCSAPQKKVWYRELLVAPIRFYQRFLSPLKPPTCRFTPSCSGYAAGSIRTHGIPIGLLLTTWRILRCQPFSVEGPDPVPSTGKWRSAFRKRVRSQGHD